jgi:DNA topoisomerase-1
MALNGRYGPYLKKGKDSRSLGSEEELFSVTLDDALAIFAQPKQRGRRSAAAPLRELGADPETGSPMVLRSGRFGPYVSDGTVNASLRRGDDPDSITPERAAELLAEKRAAGPAKPRKSARRSGKATKKTAAASKRSTTKKAGVKKAAAAKRAVTKKASSRSRS